MVGISRLSCCFFPLVSAKCTLAGVRMFLPLVVHNGCARVARPKSWVLCTRHWSSTNTNMLGCQIWQLGCCVGAYFPTFILFFSIGHLCNCPFKKRTSSSPSLAHHPRRTLKDSGGERSSPVPAWNNFVGFFSRKNNCI